MNSKQIMAQAIGQHFSGKLAKEFCAHQADHILYALQEAGFVVVPPDILQQQVLLSNFEGRKSVSVSEFIRYGVVAIMKIDCGEEDDENAG